MIKTKKNIFKPKFKKFNNNQILLSYKRKLLTFKKKKWDKLKIKLSKLSLTKKRNCYYKFYDQQSYLVNRFSNRFSNSFKNNLINKRIFKNLFGNVKQTKIKNLLKNNVSKLNLKDIIRNKFEKELSTIIVRSYFAFNIRNAKQLITHGHVKVNNLTVKSNAVKIQVGDKINFSTNMYSLLEYRLANNIMWPIIPKNLQISFKIFQIIIIDNSSNNNLSNSLEAKFDFNHLLR